MIVGLDIVADPLQGTITLTIVVSTVLVVDGIIRLFSAFSGETPHRGLVATIGIINILLGAWLFSDIPVSGLAIGFFVGLQLLMAGIIWIIGGWMARSATRCPPHPSPADQRRPRRLGVPVGRRPRRDRSRAPAARAASPVLSSRRLSARISRASATMAPMMNANRSSHTRIDGADDGQRELDAQREQHQPTPERRLEDDVGRERDQQRSPPRHDGEPDERGDRQQQQSRRSAPTRTRRAARSGCPPPARGRCGWWRCARGSPMSPASIRSSSRAHGPYRRPTSTRGHAGDVGVRRSPMRAASNAPRGAAFVAPSAARPRASRSRPGSVAERRSISASSSSSWPSCSAIRCAELVRLRAMGVRPCPGPPKPSGSFHDMPDRAGPPVLGAGRRALAGESVVGVEAEEAAVAIDPRRAVVDEHRTPSAPRPGRRSSAVAARVVDEGDAQRLRQRRGQVTRIGLSERVPPEAPHRLEQATQRPRIPGSGDLGEVLALLEVRGMRSRAGVDHRVIAGFSRVGSSQRRRSSSPT